METPRTSLHGIVFIGDLVPVLVLQLTNQKPVIAAVLLFLFVAKLVTARFIVATRLAVPIPPVFCIVNPFAPFLPLSLLCNIVDHDRRCPSKHCRSSCIGVEEDQTPLRAAKVRVQYYCILHPFDPPFPIGLLMNVGDARPRRHASGCFPFPHRNWRLTL